MDKCRDQQRLGSKSVSETRRLMKRLISVWSNAHYSACLEPPHISIYKFFSKCTWAVALQAFRMFSKVFLCLAAFSLTFSQVNKTDYFLRNCFLLSCLTLTESDKHLKMCLMHLWHFEECLFKLLSVCVPFKTSVLKHVLYVQVSGRWSRHT